MHRNILLSLCALLLGLAGVLSTGALAQQPQIPTLQVCNPTVAQGGGAVFLAGRAGPPSGVFKIEVELRCDPGGPGYPAGILAMGIDLSDSNVIQLDATSFEQVTSTGKHTPTAYLNGRCKALDSSGAPVPGCRFWVMLVDNVQPETPDVVGFLIFDGNGNRVSYGTGPLVEGDIFVAPTPF